MSARRSGRRPFGGARDWSPVSQEQRCQSRDSPVSQCSYCTTADQPPCSCLGHVMPDRQKAKSPAGRRKKKIYNNKERDCFSRAVSADPFTSPTLIFCGISSAFIWCPPETGAEKWRLVQGAYDHGGLNLSCCEMKLHGLSAKTLGKITSQWPGIYM